MKYILLLTLFLPVLVNAQKQDDTKIVVTLTDNIDLYKKTKIALVNADFIDRKSVV